MKISLIKALKSPFEKLFLIPCIIWAIMITWAYTYIQTTKDLSFMNNISIHCFMLLPYVGGLIIMIGYFSSFSHKALLGQTNLFSLPNRSLFVSGIKTFLFTLSSYLIIFSGEIAAVAGLKYLPAGLNLFSFIFMQAFMFLYLLTAWTKFSDTLCMIEPLKIVSTSQLLGKNWPSYLKITLYMLIAILILAIPTRLIRLSVLSLAYAHSWISYPGIFIMSFLYLYPAFVVLHIMAQGYVGIKNNAPMAPINQKEVAQPVAVRKTQSVKKTTTPKGISKNKPLTKKTLSKQKNTSKTLAKKKQKSLKKGK